MVAALCAARRGDPRTVALARALLSDADAATRAEAAWALGSIGEPADVARLAPILHGDDAAAAADAAAAIGRIAARAGKPGDASASLCASVGDSRPLVRSDALAGLALAHARCEGGALERHVLAGDTSEQARAAAARAVATAPGDADRAALARCARQDPSVRVASICSARPAPIPRTRRTRVYVVPEGAEAPRPLAPYALVYGDGTTRADGLADRRGAVVDPVAPDAEMRLTTAGE